MNRKLFSILAIAPALFLTACGGGGGTSEAKKESAPPAASAPPVDEASAATIAGKVSFSGDKPTMRALSMDATPACARQHSTPVKSEEVIISGDGGLKNAFVYVKAGLPDRQWPAPAEPVKLDQKGCVYNPHVLGVMVGQDIEISNSDPTNHNIHPLPKVNREWNESQAPGTDAKRKNFPREEIMLPVKCNVHPWMRTYISVVSHPFFAVSGDDGSFTIKGLPPGEYTLEAVHEKLGTQEFKVKVGAKETGKADFAFKG
jgi:plastocyanin